MSSADALDPVNDPQDALVEPADPATSNTAPHGQPVLTIGDIGVTPTHIITPNGVAPLHGSTWVVMDATTTSTKIPAYAIILAIVFALACLLGLLFLLIKETVVSGYVNVTVTSGNVQHTAQIPARSAHAIAAVRQQVAQAQSLAASAA